MAKKKSVPRKKSKKVELRKPKFAHKDIVTFTFQGQEVDGIVLSYDGEVYYVRLIGDYHELYPSILINCVEDQLSAAPIAAQPDPQSRDMLRRIWNRRAARRLKGRTIVNVRYLAPGEAEDMGWHESGLQFLLDDGTDCTLMRDDEGNGPGALNGFTPDADSNDDDLGESFTFPTCRL